MYPGKLVLRPPHSAAPPAAITPVLGPVFPLPPALPEAELELGQVAAQASTCWTQPLSVCSLYRWFDVGRTARDRSSVHTCQSDLQEGWWDPTTEGSLSEPHGSGYLPGSLLFCCSTTQENVVSNRPVNGTPAAGHAALSSPR